MESSRHEMSLIHLREKEFKGERRLFVQINRFGTRRADRMQSERYFIS